MRALVDQYSLHVPIPIADRADWRSALPASYLAVVLNYAKDAGARTGFKVHVIFSRKGFDSASAGCASPLIFDRPVSLPIPTRQPTCITFGMLAGDLCELACNLKGSRVTASTPCHLDPDIDRSVLPRRHGWRGAFGQVGAAQSHLRNQGVQTGDLFLFWGLFRPVSRTSAGTWAFDGPGEHRIFGWLQVGEVVSLGTNPVTTLRQFPWLADHPHVRSGWPASNTVYVASEFLEIGDRHLSRASAGVFTRGVRLTQSGSMQPSRWSVPHWLDPTKGGVGLTYNPLPRWNGHGGLQAAARGQEFVANIASRDDAVEWLTRLFEEPA